MKFKIFIVVICSLIPVLFWIGDIINDRNHRIVIVKTTGLYKSPEAAAYSGIPFETLQKHEKVKVKKNGIEGWVVYGHDIKVIQP